jgi:hypothetical protein
MREVFQKSRCPVAHGLLVVGIALLLTLPAFISSYLPGHDALAHQLWSQHFARQLWAGEIYPRWLLDMNNGLGSPAFFYYGPVPFYATSLFFAPIFGNLPIGIPLGLSAALALAISGWGACLWLGRLVNRKSSFLLAAAYMLMPYHLLVDLYVRFAFAEFWAFAWLPWILFFAGDVAHGSRRAFVGLAISYALLVATHLPTTLIFSFLPLGYGLVFAEGNGKMVAARLLSAMALGAALAGVYLLPALTMEDFVHLRLMTTGRFSFQNNFLFGSQQGQPERFLPFLSHLSWLAVTMAVIALLAYLVTTPADRSKKRQRTFWLIVTLTAIALMLEPSAFIWRALPPLQMIQFPYRFHLILSVSVIALLALAINSPRRPLSGNWRLAMGVILSLFLAQVLLTAIPIHVYATGEWPRAAKQELSHALAVAPDCFEYLPRWASEEYFRALQRGDPVPAQTRAEILEGSGTVVIRDWRPRKITLATSGQSELLLTIGQYYFPGWSAQLDGQKGSPAKPSPGAGLLSMKVPAGRHNLVLRLRSGSAERSGGVISLIALATLAGLWLRILWLERLHRKALL